MIFEPVLMIWDFYDGARTGLTEYNGQPCYFQCLWDETNDDYSEKFELSPVDSTFLKAATTQWEIFREWELKFHSGLVQLESHPGHRGTNPKYDRLDDELKSKIEKLIKLEDTFIPEFKVLPNQESLPYGVIRNSEANWKKVS